MKKFSSSLLLTRFIWMVGMLLATVGIAQAQTFTLTSLTPNNGAAGTLITIVGSNPTAVLANNVTFTSTTLNPTVTATAVPVVTNATATSTTLTVIVPATLTLDTYNVTVDVVVVATAVTVTSTNSLPFTVTATVLPVQLVAFAAEAAGSNALLRWNTASEKNNDRFDIESSVDGSTFTRVGSVAGNGNSILPQQYAFTDENVTRYTASLVYYRLRQVDFDGTTSFSQVRTVATKMGKTVVVLYPTVALDGQATRYAYAGPVLATGTTLEVYDLTGHRVLAQPISEITGTLQTQALASGWYWVRLAGAAPARFYRP